MVAGTDQATPAGAGAGGAPGSGGPDVSGTTTSSNPATDIISSVTGRLPVPGNLPLPGGGEPAPGGLPSLVALPTANSNALVVSAAKSQSGHPIAVFGPQVAYFAPEILMEQDVHAPTIDARGAAFAGVTPPGTQTLRMLRTKLGLVRARGTVKGRPVLFTPLRSTYRHEVDSARGFSDFNDPNKVTDAQTFQRAAAKIGYTFNWLYADDRGPKRDGDQTCFDAVSFRPLGGISQPLIPWINRPTYQQAVEIGGHRPR